MGNNFFSIASLIYNVLLSFVYFSKKRVNSFETKVYGHLILCCLTTNIIAILCYFTIKYMSYLGIINDIVSKFLLILYLLWVLLFTLYMIGVSEQTKIKISRERLVLLIFFILFIFSSLVVFLPLNYSNVDNIIYSYGPAANVVFLFSGFMVFIWFALILKNSNMVKNRKFYPLYMILLFGGIVIYIQRIRPELLLLTFLITFITFLMYFTIENPDIKMIKELEVARDAANKANMAKTDFLSSMSHEIRTPLNGIVGFSDCIMDAESLDEAKENAKDIVNASQTLLEIVNGILDISKIEAGKLEIVNTKYNAPETFDELAKLITPRMHEKGLDFTYNIASDLPSTLVGDHANLKKIVTNLLSNACKYTKVGFVHYEVNCVNTGDVCKLIISVEDSGQGIKKENIDKLFTKFQRLEEDKNTTIEGTGLGLAITKQLIELMGGKIIVHTVYGEGSKFTVMLDQKIDNGPVEETKKLKTTLNLKDVHILMVDDTPLNLKVTKKLLEKYDANYVDTCDSGFECLDKIQSGEKYDVILLDDMMPKMSGVITLKKLKEIPGFHTPTVALTANAITGMKEKYLADGFDDYLAKPIEKEQLVRVMNQILGRSMTEEIPVQKEEIKEDNTVKAVDENHSEEKTSLEELEKTHAFDLIPVVDIDTPENEEEVEETKVDRTYLEENGVDVDHALELLGDMEMYNATISDFMKEIEDKWNRIIDYKNKANMADYAIEVHSLKSDSKYLGFMKLADISYQHELKSKENDIDFVLEHFKELEEEYENILKIAKYYVEHNPVEE